MDTYEKKIREYLNNGEVDELYKNMLLNLFPELKESEDERIRKGLIKAVSRTFEGNKLYGTDVTREEALAWLEKKGRQKPIVIIPKFRIGDNIKTTNEEPLTITKIDGKGYWSEDLFICGFDDAAKWELVEQKPADKVEPKFKVGDFIVNDYCMGKVIELTGDAYLLDTGQGIPFSCEHNAHLWTIADAKDGDVLYYKSENGIEFIVMSKGLNEFGNLDSYCRYHSIGGFGIDIPSVLSAKCDSITPATKEHRDILFQKMKEAGYEWDANTKELKKIEQKSQRMISAEAKEAMYGKPAWSEEDEDVINHLIDICKSAKKFIQFASCTQDDVARCQDWLTSLKERI